MYNGDRSIAAWLKKIMVNECLMFLRKKGTLKITEEKEGMTVSVEDGTMGQMNANEMFKLIMTLPDGYRTVFNLFVVEGYGHKEIADVLGITEGTSKSQLAKARTMLQKMLGRPVKGNQRP
jgi:RNA polymerase sigma factor (sigma-70 family)